jgi:L-arginine dehydrogenase
MSTLANEVSAISHNVAPLMLQVEQIRALIPLIDVTKILRKTFLSLSREMSTQPPQTLALFADNGGDFITYSGAINELDVFGAKLSPYLMSTGKPLITAWTYLMSQRTGQPLLCCDSAELTIERTAGVTALAVNELAKFDSDTLCIIGSGKLALAHLKHVLGLRKWTSVRIFSPALAGDIARQKTFKVIYAQISFAHSIEQAVDGAHVIMLCTSSGTPVLKMSAIKPGMLVTSISTNVANAHEVPPELLGISDVYCDYKDTAPYGAGEMKIAIEQGIWSKDKLSGDLPSLMAKSCSLPTYDKPIFFRSIGLGLEDVAIAYSVWELKQKQA